MVGLDVNLRGLGFKDLKITNETVDGKPVLVIEGRDRGRVPQGIELPRLRFSVATRRAPRSTPGTRCWSRTTLKAGEPRLVQAPPRFFRPRKGAISDVRFFSKRDLVSGQA